MFQKAVRFLRNLAIVLLVLFFLGVAIHQLLPRESREKVDLVFMQTYQVLGEGWKPQGVYPRYTQYVSWDEEHRGELLAAYPVSEEGRELLSQSFFGEIPFNHYARGYAKPFEMEAWTTVSRPQLTFHEFSHVAFGKLVVGERRNFEETNLRLQKALVESFTNPKYRDIFTVCYAKKRDLSYFGMDPEHALIAILEWSGGNSALVPEPLREFAPWIEEGEIESWEELAKLYLRADEFGRDVLELHYGEDNPFWDCVFFDLCSSEFGHRFFTLSESTYPYSPSETDLVFLEAEEREIRWFFAARGEGAFAFWEKYFDHDIDSYKQDLIRRLVERHSDLGEEFAFEIFEYSLEHSQIELYLPSTMEIYFSSDFRGRWTDRFHTGRGSIFADAEELEVDQFLTRLGYFEYAYGVDIVDRLGLGEFLEGLVEGGITPQQIVEFRLSFNPSGPFDDSLAWGHKAVAVAQYCLLWEGSEQGLPTVIAVRYAPVLLRNGLGEAISGEVKYGVSNSCYGGK